MLGVDDNTGSYAYVGTEGIGEISGPSSQCCCELKTTLKNKMLKKKKATQRNTRMRLN